MVKRRTLWLLAGGAATLLIWLMWRKPAAAAGASSEGGHSSPEEAITYGWMVDPSGIGGWLETSPDGSQSIRHASGWTGDPFTRS